MCSRGRSAQLTVGSRKMGEVLLTGVNHVAFATRDLKATTAFYSEVFDLAVTALGDGNALLLFPNGSFLQFIDGTEYPATERVQRDVGGALLYEGESIDHLALFASDSDALEIIRERARRTRCVDRGTHRHRGRRDDGAVRGSRRTD